MSVYVLKRIGDISNAMILAPERFDPRRRVEMESARCLADYADVLTENVSVKTFSKEKSVLILDTTHAYEGFVIFRHNPVSPNELGSVKRKLNPGDVIISRLRPYLRQIAYVDPDLFHQTPNGNEVVSSSEFFVLRGKNGFDAACLVPVLLSNQVQNALAAGQEGGHHPRFSKELLLSIPISKCIIENSHSIANNVRLLAANIRHSLIGCKDLVKSIETTMKSKPS